MHKRTTLRRLGVIVSTVLVTVGLAAFPAYTLADNGGNGNGGNGNGNGNGGNGNGNGGNGNGNGNGGNGDADANGNRGGNGVDQVVICHLPPGNPGNEHTIIVGEPAVDAHVDNHDDTVGPCDAATSTTTSTSIASTSPAVAPVALPDILLQDATAGQPFSLNVLANDDLGNPVATITADTFDPTLQTGCIGLSFDPATGVIAGTPTQGGTCPFAYVIQNSAGFSLTQVLVPVLD